METLPCGNQAYVTGSGPRAVVVASDIFGIHTGRHKEICDEIAAEGFLVVMPDFFKGAFPDKGVKPSFLDTLLQAPGLLGPINTPWESVEDQLKRGVLPFLEQRGCAAGCAGLVGFCWGAWVVMKASASMPDKFACGACAHPSVSAVASRWGEDEYEMYRKIQTPQLVIASKDEPPSWKPEGKVARTIRAASPDAGHAFSEFGSMEHGFVPRGDMSDFLVNPQVCRAMTYIKNFLDKHIPAE